MESQLLNQGWRGSWDTWQRAATILQATHMISELERKKKRLAQVEKDLCVFSLSFVGMENTVLQQQSRRKSSPPPSPLSRAAIQRMNAEDIQLLLSATNQDNNNATATTTTTAPTSTTTTVTATPTPLTSTHPIPHAVNIPQHLLIPPTVLPHSLGGNLPSVLHHVPPPQSTPIYPKKIEDVPAALRDTAAELLQSILAQLNDPNGGQALGIDLTDLPTDQAGLDKFLGEFVAALNSEEDQAVANVEGASHQELQGGIGVGNQIYSHSSGFTSINGYQSASRHGHAAQQQDAEAKKQEKAKVRQENRERKKRWREFNQDRNKDNDLRCRVVKRATKIFGVGKDDDRKRLWIEEEFQKRKMKREAKERARNQDHYAPYPDYQQRASLPPQQQQPQQQQQQQQQPQNPESTELRPVQNDPALLSAIETLASVARLSDTPNLNATELVKMIISDSQHLSLFSQLIRENQQKRVGNAAPNPPNSYPITYSNTTPTPSTPNNGFQTPLGQGGHYVDFNHPITANSSRSNSIQDTPSPTSSSFSDLMGTPTRIPLGSTPSTPVMMQNQQLVAPSTPAQPSYTPQSEAPTISTGTTPMPVPVPTVSAPQSVESSSPARAPRAPVAPVAPVAPIAPTANGNSQAPVRPSPGGQRAPMAPMAPVAPMAPTGPRVVPQEANKWSFASKEVNMLLPSALPMPAPLPQASQKELSPVASSSASPVVPATPSLAATAEVAPTALAAPPIPITNPTPDVPPTSAVPVAPTLPATNNSPERMTGSTLLSVSNEIQKTMGQPQAPIDLTGPEFDDDISPSNAGAKVAEVSLTTPTPDSTSQTSIVTAPETKQPEPRAESTQNEMPSANSMTLSDQPCNSNVPEPVQASPMSPTIKESAALVPSGAEASAPKQPVEGLQSGKSSEAEQPVQEREPFIPFGYGPTFDLSRESEEEQRALDEIIANFQGTHHDVEMSDSHPEPPQNTPEPSSNLTVPADMIDHFTQPHHLDTDMDDLDGWDLPELPEPHVLQAEAAARAQAAELEMAKQATASEHRDTAMLGSPSVLQAQEQLEQQAEDRSPPHLEAQKPVQTDAESNGQAASQPEKTSAAQTESQAREQPPSQTETQTQTQSEVPKAPDLGAYDETQKETPSLSQGEQPQRLSVDVLPSAQPEGLPDQGTKVHSALEFGQAAVQSVGKEVEAQHSTETVSQVSSQAVPALSGTQAAQAAMAPEASAQSTVGQSQVVSEQPRESSVVPGADAFAGLDLEGLVLDDETMALLEQAVQDESMMADLVEMLKNDVPAQPVQPTQVAQPTQPTQPTPPSGATISTAPEAASEPVLQNQEPVAAIPKAPSEETTTSNPHIDNGINHVDPFDMTAFNTGVNTPLNTGLNTPIGNQNIDFDEFERHLAELENTNMEGTNRTLDDATLDELLAELEGELKADNATNATVAPAAPESNPPQFSQQPETQTQLEVQLDFDPMEIDINQITEQLTDEELAALLQGDDLNFTLTAEDIANLKQTVNGIGQQEQQQQPQGILNGQTLDISTLEGAARELAMDEATHHALRQLLQALEQNPNLIDRCVNGQIDVSSLTGAGQKRAWDGHGDQGMAKRTNIAPIPNMSGLSAPRPMSSAVPPRPPYSTSSRSAKADENAEAYKASFGNSAAMNRRLMAPPAFRTPSITYGFSTSIPPKKKTDENKVKSMGFPPMLAGLKKPTPPTPQCT